MAEWEAFPALENQRPYRLLDEDDDDDDNYDDDVSTTGDVLKNTFMIYGSIFAGLFLIFLFVRKRYPRAYNVRNTIPELNCALAEDTLGTFRWIYRVFLVPEEDMYEQCGLDAIVYLRMLRYGTRVAFMGIFNSIYLMPIYGTSPSTETNITSGGFEKITLGYVPEKDARVFAAVVAAYVFFGYAMFLLMKEFQWFTKYRHDFLSRARPDNYSVYVSGIPPEYRTNEALTEYFGEVYTDAVLEATVALNLKNLEYHVEERAKIVPKLEHALNVLNIKGERPTHRAKKSSCCGKSEKVDSIDAYTEQLGDYNDKISKTITVIEEHAGGSTVDGARESDEIIENSSEDEINSSTPLLSSFSQDAATHDEDGDKKPDQNSKTSQGNDSKHGEGKSTNAMKSAISATGAGVSTGITAMSSAAMSLLGAEDGTPMDAAFVTFSSLRARVAALQMIHHETPFTMVILPAPLPKDVFWGNVGMTHKTQQLSFLLGQSLTALLCIFWAVPVTFVASLANVDTLKEEIPFLRNWINSAPWLGDFFAQLAPLLLLILAALLPKFLMIFAEMEGHVSTGRLTAVFFVKLCIFNIIHTFLIVTISGSIFESIQAIVNEPSLVVEMLAASIPSQASFFIQYSLVLTFLSKGLEIIRFFPIVGAYLRTKVGPNLTEKERNTRWGFLAPLSIPHEFEHAADLSDLLLFFLILFVYSVMSPIMSFVQAFAFGVTGMVYRHQLIYIYPKSNDSGGLLWAQAVKVIIACMFIAQITLFGVLGLKKSPGAVIMLIPLIIITALFTFYLQQQHYVVTNYLPSITAIKKDKENIANNFDYEFLKNQYKQPALLEKHVEPDNMPESTSDNRLNYTA